MIPYFLMPPSYKKEIKMGLPLKDARWWLWKNTQNKIYAVFGIICFVLVSPLLILNDAISEFACKWIPPFNIIWWSTLKLEDMVNKNIKGIQERILPIYDDIRSKEQQIDSKINPTYSDFI